MRAGGDGAMVAKRVRVLQMLPDLDSGGVEQGTLEIGNYLVAHGHHSLVISRGGRMVPALTAGGSRHITMPWIGEKSPRALTHIPALRRLLKNVDILHLRSRVPAWAGYLAWKSLPAASRPYLVTTFHGVYSINAYSAVMTKGETVIAVSDGIRAHIEASYPKVNPSRIKVIHRGGDTRRFDPDSISMDTIAKIRKEWGADTETPVILMPGRFTRLKGQDLLLSALQTLDHQNWIVVLVGDPAENPGYAIELQGKAEDLNGRVVFAGYRPDMPEMMAAADIVVSASRKPESFGRTLVEAGMMGKPVVASGHGGSLEIVVDGKTGLLYPSEDIHALGNALSVLMQSREERSRMGIAGLARCQKNFTTNTMCKRTLDLYLKRK